MSQKMKLTTYNPPTPQILAIPDHYVAIAFLHAKAVQGSTGLATLVDNRYIVKAGTPYPANDATAVGVILNDYDVTDGDQNMAVVIHGFVKTAALPVVPVAAAITALKMIQFVPIGASITVTYLSGVTVAALYDAGDTAVTAKTVLLQLADELTFADAATTLSNWTITGESTVKATVTGITLSTDKKTATIAIATAATALVAGDITIAPKAAAVAIGKIPATAMTIATIAAGE